MKTFRRTMDVDGITNVETLVAAVLQEENKRKYKLTAVAYGECGKIKGNKLIMDFVLVENGNVKNFVKQVSKKRHPGVDPDKYAKTINRKECREYIGYIEPKPEKLYLLFFA